MKKLVLPLFAFAAVATLLVLAAILTPREPCYEGKTLSYWMGRWYSGTGGAQGVVNPSTEAAVRAIGTNGLRYYIVWLDAPTRSTTDIDYRSRALHAFEILGPTAKPAIPELIGMLGHGGNWVGLALAYIGKDSVPALTNFLATNAFSKVPRGNRRGLPWMAEHNAIEALSYMGTNAEGAVPCLIRFLQAANSRSQWEAVGALAEVGRNRPEWVVPVLVQALTNAAVSSRARAAEALGTFESQAAEAIPRLQLACQDQDPQVRTSAAAAFKRILPNAPSALLPLVQNLTNRTALVRQQALWALESLGPNGLDAFPVVLGASLHDPVPEVRRIAVGCIVAMGRFNDEVLAGLVENLSCPNESVRSEAIGAIARNAPGLQSAFKTLMKASCSQYKDVREQARSSVTEVAYHNPSFLVASFEDPDPDIRNWAFRILYHGVDLEQKTGVSALVKALTDDDPRVRESATNTLRQVFPAAAQTAGVTVKD